MPSAPNTRTYYDILGVNRVATADAIKTAYRALARTLHPDVNPGDPQAGAKFAEISTAYKTLSDKIARANYDAELSLAERRAETARARAGGSPSYATYSTQNARPASPNAARPVPNTASGGDEAARLLTTARAALSRMRFVEARDLAQSSLRIRRTAEGYEVLGDVYRMQGRTDDAINMYTMSLQLNPRNSAMMDRLQRLAQGSGNNARKYEAPRVAETSFHRETMQTRATPAPPPAPSRPGAVGANILPEKRPLLQFFAVVFGYGTVFLLLLTLMLFLREAPLKPVLPLAAVSHWSGGLLAVLIGCGIALGWTMSVTGVVRRLDDELVFSRAQSGFVPPMGWVVLLLSAVSFWAAALLHTLLSVLQEARIGGMLKAFGAVVAVVALAAAFYDPVGQGQLLLWGGNIVFLSYVFGWYIGDLFRAD